MYSVSNNIISMSWVLIVTLISIGLLFLLLEVLVLPGTTVAGIIGGILIIFGIVQAYQSFGNMAGHLTIGGTAIATFLVLYFSIRSRTWDRLALHTEIDGKMNTIDEQVVKVGELGLTVSRLAPSGKARINGDIFEVHTSGSFIDPGKEVIVVKVSFNKIFVELKTE